MFDFFYKIRISVFLSAVMTCIMGLILVIAPGTAIRTVFLLVGWILVISGALTLLTAVLTRGQPVGQGDLVLGLIQVASGIVVLTRPGFLMSMCGVVIGFLILLHGVRDIQSAKEGKALGYKYRLPQVIGIVTLVMGILVMARPFSVASSVLRLAGICLLVDGVSDLLVILYRGK